MWLWQQPIQSFSTITIGIQRWMLRPLIELIESDRVKTSTFISLLQKELSKKESLRGPNKRKQYNQPFIREPLSTFSRKIWFWNWWLMNSTKMEMQLKKSQRRMENRRKEASLQDPENKWTKWTRIKTRTTNKTRWWEELRASKTVKI